MWKFVFVLNIFVIYLSATLAKAQLVLVDQNERVYLSQVNLAKG